jgi:hypothetical protein
LEQLRLRHLDKEERKLLNDTCLAYMDVFYLPGDRLSSMNATRYSINLESGVEPICTKPYRLLESQKVDTEKHVEKLKKEGITEENNSLCNSELPVKMDTSGKQKFRLIVDYRKLNDKIAGDAYLLPDITEILDQLRRALGIFLFTTASRTALGPTHTPIQWVPGALSPAVKRLGRETDHSRPSSVQVKECVELYLHSQYAFMAWCLVKHRENFTFTF